MAVVWKVLLFLSMPWTTASLLRSGIPGQFERPDQATRRHLSDGTGTVSGCPMKDSVGDDDDDHDHPESSSRRDLFTKLPSLAIPALSLLSSNPRGARAELVQFPCRDGLMNRYHFMRAGQSLLEERNILATNPLFLTNRDAALSVAGREQVLRASRIIESNGINPSVVKFSLAANAMDTADAIASELRIGRNRLVPEYTYMDQRGAGRWDMLPLDTTEKALWALDVNEAGQYGLEGRPPPHYDGTPNETLGNQITRLRQLISLLETSLSGDDILLIFPDGTGPALLSVLIGGIPVHRVHEASFAPGEIRFDVNYDTVQSIWNGSTSSSSSSSYAADLERGQDELKRLVALDPSEILNAEETEQAALEARRALARENAERDRVKRAERYRKEEAQRRAFFGDPARDRRLAQKRAEEEKKKRSRDAVAADSTESRRRRRSASIQDGTVRPLDPLSAVPPLGLAAITMAFGQRPTTKSSETASDSAVINATEQIIEINQAEEENEKQEEESNQIGDDGQQQQQQRIRLEEEQKEEEEKAHDLDLQLRALEENLRSAPIGIPPSATTATASVIPPRRSREERLQLAHDAMEAYMNSDDGGEAWLGFMTDLATEDDYDDDDDEIGAAAAAGGFTKDDI